MKMKLTSIHIGSDMFALTMGGKEYLKVHLRKPACCKFLSACVVNGGVVLTAQAEGDAVVIGEFLIAGAGARDIEVGINTDFIGSVVIGTCLYHVFYMGDMHDYQPGNG